MGRYSVNLVGEANYQDAVARANPGDHVQLLHEPDNPHDSDAVKAVDLSGSTLGYLARDSWLTRVLVYERKPVVARIELVTGGVPGKPSRGVVLEVLTGADVDAGFGAVTPPPTAAPLPPPVASPKREPFGCGAMAALGLGVMVLIYAFGGPAKAPETAKALPLLSAEKVTQCRDYLAQARRQGLIRRRPSPERIDVNERLWRGLDAREKDVTLQALACDLWQTEMPRQIGEYVVVYGAKSGKRLQMLTSAGMARD